MCMGKEGLNGSGVLVNSERFSGMSVNQARREIVSHAETLGVGGHMTQYKLRDWLISRQRYWGAPIPILYCEKCGVSIYNNAIPISVKLQNAKD